MWLQWYLHLLKGMTLRNFTEWGIEGNRYICKTAKSVAEVRAFGIVEWAFRELYVPRSRICKCIKQKLVFYTVTDDCSRDLLENGIDMLGRPRKLKNDVLSKKRKKEPEALEEGNATLRLKDAKGFGSIGKEDGADTSSKGIAKVSSPGSDMVLPEIERLLRQAGTSKDGLTKYLRVSMIHHWNYRSSCGCFATWVQMLFKATIAAIYRSCLVASCMSSSLGH